MATSVSNRYHQRVEEERLARRASETVSPEQIARVSDYVYPSEIARVFHRTDSNTMFNCTRGLNVAAVQLRNDLTDSPEYPVRRHNQIAAIEVSTFGILSGLRISQLLLDALHPQGTAENEPTRALRDIATTRQFRQEDIAKLITCSKEAFIALVWWEGTKPTPDIERLKALHALALNANKKSLIDFQADDWRILGVDMAITMLADRIFEIEAPQKYAHTERFLERLTGIPKYLRYSIPHLQQHFVNFIRSLGTQFDFHHSSSQINFLPSVKSPSSLRGKSDSEIRELHDLFRVRILCTFDEIRNLLLEIERATDQRAMRRLSFFSGRNPRFKLEYRVKTFSVRTDSDSVRLDNDMDCRNAYDAFDQMQRVTMDHEIANIALGTHAAMLFLHISDKVTNEQVEFQFLAREFADKNADALRVYAINKNLKNSEN